MKIILDFDDAIFNTGRMIDKFIQVFQRVGFSKNEFHKNYNRVIKEAGDFDFDIAVKLLMNIKRFDREKVIEELKLVLDRADDFVFSDFYCFANKVKKDELILLSFGTTNFQKKKIEKSGVLSYFSEVIISSNNKADEIIKIAKKYNENIIFIEDKATHIDNVKERLPNIVTMKIIRPQGRHIESKSKLTNYIIQDLFQIEGIINNLRR